MGDIQQILWIELLGGIGDGLIALPAIQAVGRSHPSAHLTVLTFAPGHELLQTDPLIHRVIAAPRGSGRQAVEELLNSESFDLVISDTNYDNIDTLIQQYRQRHGDRPQIVTNLWRSPPPDERVGDRFLTLLVGDGVIHPGVLAQSSYLHLTTTEKAIAHRALGALYRPLVVLYPEAGMAIKQWPMEHFITLGQALHQQYGATLIVPVGTNLNLAQAIVDALGEAAHLWKRGSLRSLAAMMAEADLVVAADTGPARIAAALQVPTITLFGPSWYGRYGQPTPHVNLQGFPACPERVIHNFTQQSCWYSHHCPFDWATCLNDISPTTVLEAASHILDQKWHRIPGSLSAQKPSSLSPPPPAPASPSPSLPPPWNTVRNLLVLRLDNIGDVIMTSPVFKTLRENLPEAKITLMASPGGALTAPLLPWIDEVLPWRVLWQDLGRLDFNPDREWELIQTLQQRNFDAAIILTSFSQSPHPAALICTLAGIPLRLGESQEQDLGTLTHAILFAPDHIHQVERNLRLIESVGFAVGDRRLSLAIPQVANLPRDPYLLLNPWTSCQSRNYHPVRFAEAARRLSQITGWPVVITGVDKDRERSSVLFETLGDRAIDQIGKTSLSELVALIAQAQLVLTNNTSTMHIADATGTPNVVLFAGTEKESQWQPRHSPSRLLRRPTVCSPCYQFQCPYNLECLDIPVEVVVEAGLEVLGRSPRIPPLRLKSVV